MPAVNLVLTLFSPDGTLVLRRCECKHNNSDAGTVYGVQLPIPGLAG